MRESIVRPEQLSLPRRIAPARIFVGGAGQSVLLLHGGWGDAEIHWSRIWDRLAEHYRVIAPELPGFGPDVEPPCGSVREYVQWLVELLDGLQIDRVHCVGNSFGASLAWSFAGRVPDRCASLVMVNGPPMPSTPAPMLRLGRTSIGGALMRALVGRISFHPSALARAFVEPTRAPAELSELLRARRERLIAHFATVLIEGDGPPAPKVRPLLLWGGGDELPGTKARDARRLHRSLAGSTLRLLPDAGHFPQLEAPDAFVRELRDFIERSARQAADGGA